MQGFLVGAEVALVGGIMGPASASGSFWLCEMAGSGCRGVEVRAACGLGGLMGPWVVSGPSVVPGG